MPLHTLPCFILSILFILFTPPPQDVTQTIESSDPSVPEAVIPDAMLMDEATKAEVMRRARFIAEVQQCERCEGCGGWVRFLPYFELVHFLALALT